MVGTLLIQAATVAEQPLTFCFCHRFGVLSLSHPYHSSFADVLRSGYLYGNKQVFPTTNSASRTRKGRKDSGFDLLLVESTL